VDVDREKGEWPTDRLPEGWEWVPFEETFDDRTSAEKKVKQGDYLESGALPVIDQGQEIVGGYTNNGALAYDGRLPAIVFGDHTKTVKFLEERFAQGADGVRVLAPTNGFIPRFAFLALKALRLPDKGYSRHFKFLKASQFPLAPLAEQQRIVAKVEELTARSRRVKEALDAVPALVDQLHQSILAAAFRGDLTVDWRARNRDVEPAAKLLARIPTGSQGAVGRSAVSDNAYPLPASWVWSSVQEVSDFVTDGTHQPPPTTTHGVPFIGIRNILGGRIDWGSVDRWVSPETYRTLTSRYRACRDDILYATVGATFGQSVLVEDDREFMFQRHIAHVRPTPSVLPRYLAACLSSPFCFEQARRKARGAAQPTVNLSDLRAFVIPLPPLAEQEALVTLASKAVREMESVSEASLSAAERLRQLELSILAKAFRGELVPRDADDEPAAVLLERIRRRENAQPEGSRTRRQSRTAESVTGDSENDGDENAVTSIRSDSARTPPKDLSEVKQEVLVDEVFAALWTLGPLEKDEAVRRVADHLRQAGYIRFERLRTDGPLFGQLIDAIESAVKAGRLDRPKRGHVRACKTDATAYTADDWRHALVASLGIEPTDRDEAIRAAAEWARDNLGLEFTRLRGDGHIVEGLRSALNSAIRRGDVIRHDATHISRAGAVQPALELKGRSA
jgi:type I restriction enzyme S subunit